MRHVGRFLTVNCSIAKKGTSAGIGRNRTVYLAAVGSRLVKYPRPSNASSGIPCEFERMRRFPAENHCGTSLRIMGRGCFIEYLCCGWVLIKHVCDDLDEVKGVTQVPLQG